MDLTGNITIVDSKSKELIKYYIVLFTCTATRACHLEVVNDLSAHCFLNAFRRFVSRRSCPRLMISDNATNFKLSSELLKKLNHLQDVQQHLDNSNCEWKFITPRAPQQGGFYERLIGIVKNCLRKVLFKRKVSHDELVTIATEIENRVNNRPLSYVDTSLDGLEPLTPSHLLYGYRLNSLPVSVHNDYLEDPNFLCSDKQMVNERFGRLSKVIESFQQHWRKAYLTSLREFHHAKADPNKIQTSQIKLNQVVLIYNDCPRSLWKLGKVIELLPGQDQNLRVVKLRTAQGETLRSIDKLYPLECDTDMDIPDYSNAVPALEKENESLRPRRRAAIQSQDFVKSLIQSGDL